MIGKVIESLLSSTVDIYPIRAIEGKAVPYAVYSVVSNAPTNTKQGVSRLDVVRVQIDVYSNLYSQCVSLSDSIRTALDRYAGTVSTVVVDKIVFENETDGFDDEAEYYRRTQDYFIRIKL